MENMIYLISLGIVVISALLWRIRGGLWKKYIPENKIWYALFFGICGYFHFGNSLEKPLSAALPVSRLISFTAGAYILADYWKAASLIRTLCNIGSVS